MSKLDELLDRAPFAFDGSMESMFEVESIAAARTELAALRRRAEDAEMIARSLWRDPNSHGLCPAHGGGAWLGKLYMPPDPATGLPILTDEARRALEVKP